MTQESIKKIKKRKHTKEIDGSFNTSLTECSVKYWFLGKNKRKYGEGLL